jgi:hypothetical protein
MLFLLKASYFRKFLDWTFHFREGLFSKWSNTNTVNVKSSTHCIRITTYCRIRIRAPPISYLSSFNVLSKCVFLRERLHNSKLKRLVSALCFPLIFWRFPFLYTLHFHCS